MSELPLLDPRERLELEGLAGRPLTNDEAQLLRRERVLIAAFQDWLEARTMQPADKLRLLQRRF